MTDFPEFFRALWKKDPFPWQTMLAKRAAGGDWPQAINLPTASGKTACLDAAVFALAATAAAPVETRMPRRIWFVVDRRIVVDEAFRRAKEIARKLAQAGEGPLKEIADLLRQAAGNDRPLAVARLRGGTWRDDGWARLPSQPAIICSTVDQVGSALLFRAYGHSDRTASIYAGLAAHDSLILLDEAHCAVPFMQTLAAVARFRGEAWADQPLKTPFRCSIMSATPPNSVLEDATFPKPAERAAALDHPVLKKRLTASKPAILAKIKERDGEFISAAVAQARQYAAGERKRRVAVMVNRVATAREIADRLRKEAADAEVVLLTGRMRPLDRDALVKRWEDRLKAGSVEVLDKSVIVVTTQCLEVGADFSFDALVTECASLDALRQRFGRLNRFGELEASPAAILIREKDTKAPKDNGDPIYGHAIYETWTWLNEPGQRGEDGVVDFGVAALGPKADALRASDEKKRFERLLAPAPEAPILLPAHLDMLCQTSPRPVPEPDVSFFLHGKDRAAPEARVVFRCDLTSEEEETWLEALSLVPPASPEMLAVPLHRLRRWLAEQAPEDTDGDVEGGVLEAEEQDAEQMAPFKFLIWRGRRGSKLTNDVRLIRPNDVIVLRLTDRGLGDLGQSIEDPEGLGEGGLDLAEHALKAARGRAVLRVNADVLKPFRNHACIADLIALAEAEPDPEDVKAALQAVLDENSGSAGSDVPTPFLPVWLAEIVDGLVDGGFRMEDSSAGGFVLVGKKDLPASVSEAEGDGVEDDPFADEDDLASKSNGEVAWRQHTADVRTAAEKFAAHCLGEEFGEAINAAACGHDLGKLDRRFQLFLRGGDEIAVLAEGPLAKSADVPERRRKRKEISEDSRLPEGFRHEFLSMQLADRFGLTPSADGARDVALHLIASHHGHARPFAPVVVDGLVAEGKAGDVCLKGTGIDEALNAAERQKLAPAHRLDSGVPDRFWLLTRRYGWWGLAYLEAVFRLADWEASRRPGRGDPDAPQISHRAGKANSAPCNAVTLDALDGANPLAFLAALGTLRALAQAWPQEQPSLSWHVHEAAWRPIIRAGCLPSDWKEAHQVICSALTQSLGLGFTPTPEAEAERRAAQKSFEEARLKLRNKLKEIRGRKLKGDDLRKARERESAPLFEEVLGKRRVWLCRLKCAVPSLEMALGQRINVPPEEFREFLELAVESGDRWAVDQLAHFGSDACLDRKRGEIKPTPFSFVNGSGRQFFLDTARQLVSVVDQEKVHSALFEPWRPSDQKLSMRWDPCEDRRYALMAEDPAGGGNEPRTIWAANLLAYFGLGLLPSAPTYRGLGTVAIVDVWENPAFTWPIWEAFLSPASVSSLLASPELTVQSPLRKTRRDLGVAVVLRSERIEVGAGTNIKLNFARSRPL
jgi:CRISPR-associated endonuclease/helicase Cas3